MIYHISLFSCAFFSFITTSSLIRIRPSVPIYVCVPFHWKSVGHEIFQYFSETLLGFLLPFTFILACYISVICRLRSAMFQRKGRGSILILLIIGAFTVFWLPYHLVNILQVCIHFFCIYP